MSLPERERRVEELRQRLVELYNEIQKAREDCDRQVRYYEEALAYAQQEASRIGVMLMTGQYDRTNVEELRRLQSFWQDRIKFYQETAERLRRECNATVQILVNEYNRLYNEYQRLKGL
jgi:hypothetical protein